MKSVMYHYIRTPKKNLPYFTFLHVDDFVQQVQYLKSEYGLVEREEFLNWVMNPRQVSMPEGVILTFDDGFADHFRYVAPVLGELGAWGLFYVPTGVLHDGKVLDVHRIHLLLGSLGGHRCMSLLEELTEAKSFPDSLRREFSTDTYTRQATSPEIVKQFKRMMNYFVDYGDRSEILDHLIRIGILEEDWEVWSRGFYMTADSILCLHREGHIIGSHSVSHRVMSKLSAEVQSQEIRESVMTLATITGAKPITFCYPYGGFHSFTDETEELLREAGIRFSFNVEQRDIQPFDLINRPHALPRYDCNQFPFGEVTVGR